VGPEEEHDLYLPIVLKVERKERTLWCVFKSFSMTVKFGFAAAHPAAKPNMMWSLIIRSSVVK
jgi:hypothetical protein